MRTRVKEQAYFFQNEAANRVTLEAVECYVKFTSFLDNTDLHEHGGTADRLATGFVVEPCSRSRSPPRKLKVSDIGMGNDGTFDQYIGKRIVKVFDGLVFLGSATEKIREVVLAKQPDGSTIWQIVWKVVFDDEDSEEMNRLEIIDAINCIVYTKAKTSTNHKHLYKGSTAMPVWIKMGLPTTLWGGVCYSDCGMGECRLG